MNGILWDKLFPFHIRIDQSLRIVSAGRSIKKLVQGMEGADFGERFSIKRPKIDALTYPNLLELFDTLLLITIKDHQLILRGQVVLDENKDLVFCGSPWMSDTNRLDILGLQFNDFALHDPIMDMLQLISFHSMSNLELNVQAEALKKAKLEAELALKSRNAFFSTMTHEIRTPLNGVIGMTHELLEEHPREDQINSLETLAFFGGKFASPGQ